MFGLDPQSIVGRAKASGQPPHAPTLRESVLRGMIGFTLVSLGGFAPWVLAGRWFYRNVGEAGLYAVCAVIFIGLSGLLLHRLIIGAGSLVRFYKIFSLAFAIYAVAWTIGWMAVRGYAGSIAGLLAGTVAMGAILACGFKANGAALKIIVVLFVTNAAGYFIGEWGHNFILRLKEGNALGFVLERSMRAMLSKAAWGLFYGLGFGGGIGFAFHACQAEARQMMLPLKSSAKASVK
jgi:hypothetical protein